MYKRQHIGKVTDLAGINRKVSYYSARKTFAQHGYDIGIEIEKIEYCIGPVSYTHLDVYKRQA